MSGEKKGFSLYTSTMVVVANMIGTGVFTSIGFQVIGITSASVIIVLWLLGGVMSLLGALCYAELAASIKKSGGEYAFLSYVFGKPVGFMAAWISILVGFAAPVAAAAVPLGDYFTGSLHLEYVYFIGNYEVSLANIFALSVILIVTIVHSFSHKASSFFQNISTSLKIGFVLVLIAIGLVNGNTGGNDFTLSDEMFSVAFVISLYWVSYSYSGWNAASYIAGEVENPGRNVPRALLMGTGMVTLLYVLLNLVFTWALPFDQMRFQKDVGLIFANEVLGTTWGSVMGLVISFLLVSSVSSMVLAGPRVSRIMAAETGRLPFLARVNRNGIPTVAIVVQCILTFLYVISARFDQVIIFIGFTLNLFTFLTVLGLIVHRIRFKDADRPFKTPLYPLVPILFLVLQGWILVYGIIYKPWESCIGLGFALAGLLVYFATAALGKKQTPAS